MVVYATGQRQEEIGARRKESICKSDFGNAAHVGTVYDLMGTVELFEADIHIPIHLDAPSKAMPTR
jgi:hypothetical protein